MAVEPERTLAAQVPVDKEEPQVVTKAGRVVAVPAVALDRAQAVREAIRAAKARGVGQEPGAVSLALALAVAKAVAAKVDRELMALAGKEPSTSGQTTGARASPETTRPR